MSKRVKAITAERAQRRRQHVAQTGRPLAGVNRLAKKSPHTASLKGGVFGAVEVAEDGFNTSSPLHIEPGPQVPLEAPQNSFTQKRADHLGGKPGKLELLPKIGDQDPEGRHRPGNALQRLPKS
eukprot:6564579-Pyramimonas_sp.AAC.1